jgi:hypothetical protein
MYFSRKAAKNDATKKINGMIAMSCVFIALLVFVKALIQMGMYIMQMTKNKRENVYKNAILKRSGFLRTRKISFFCGFLSVNDDSFLFKRRSLYLLDESDVWNKIVVTHPPTVSSIARFWR